MTQLSRTIRYKNLRSLTERTRFLEHAPPQKIEKRPWIYHFYHLLLPNILVCPPNILTRLRQWEHGSVFIRHDERAEAMTLLDRDETEHHYSSSLRTITTTAVVYVLSLLLSMGRGRRVAGSIWDVGVGNPSSLPLRNANLGIPLTVD